LFLLTLFQYVGETNNQVRNLFSLAQKLAPCILCIDELDGLFRERSDSEHEVSRDLKTEFLQWWDGMLTDPSSSSATAKRQPILVIGASNRPFDVDAAVLRRLPAAFYVGLPDAATRTFYLRRLLEKIPSDVDLHRVAMMTEGYSPSDLRQVLQSAAVMGPMKEFSIRRRSMEAEADRDDDTKSTDLEKLRPRNLETRDVLMALAHSPPTPLSSDYRRALKNFARLNLPHFSTPDSLDGFRDGLDTSMLDTKWETSEGTFYHLGQLDVDPHTFDTLFDVMSHFSSQSEDSTDSEDDETDQD
jgi:ATPase family AAA domain-containing protein 1